MLDILKRFEVKYAGLKKQGLMVHGLARVNTGKWTTVISISRPLIFDSRLLPKKFEGLKVKAKIQGQLPDEFKINRDSPEAEYIWAPERFEKFVERCEEEIKQKLAMPDMKKEEILDAICFGSYQEHKLKCDNLVKEGKIKRYKEAQLA
jgi:hypothetical protein